MVAKLVRKIDGQKWCGKLHAKQEAFFRAAATRVSTASVSLQLLFNIKITTMVIPLLVRDLFDQAIKLLPVPHLLSDDKFCHRDSFNSTITAFKRGHQKRGKLLPDLCHRK